MDILGIVEIVLNVDDLPLVRDFYIDVFGFSLHLQSEHEDPEHPVAPGEPTICFLKVCSSDTPLGRNVHPPMLVLIDYKRHAAARKRFTSLETEHSRFNHMAFEISPDSYEDWFARLKNKGLSPAEVVFYNVQGKAMFVRDPEGNSVELICQVIGK